MRKTFFPAVAGVFFLLANSVAAGSIAESGQEAEALLQNGDSIGALEALDSAMQTIWEKSPLAFRKMLLVESAEAYGVYRPRSSSQYKSGVPLVVYAEPVGFSYGSSALAGFDMRFAVDFALSDTNDAELFSKNDFLNVGLASLYRNREFYLKMTVNLTGLPAGKYKAKFHIRDVHSQKTGDFALPFEIVE